MVLIKVPNKYYKDDFSRLIKFYRENPIIAAEHLLKRDGEPLMLAPIQKLILMEWFNSKFNLLTASRGTGKCNPHGTGVLTPEGWRKIENLRVGDKVITPKGIKSKIIGIYPQGYLPTYKITFKDGRTAYCSSDHLWAVKGYKCRNDTWTVVSTKEIKEWIDKYSITSHHKIRIPLVDKLFFNKKSKKLPIHPYLLGALVGDGCTRYSRVLISTSDNFIIDKISSILGNEYKLNKCIGKYDYRIVDTKCIKFGGKIGTTPNRLTTELHRLGLRDKYSYEKFIPDLYMNLSRRQTLELIQGLFDTDGTVQGSLGRNKKITFNNISYCTTSEVLAKQIQALIWKLGGICKISTKIPFFTYKGTKKQGRLAYILSIRYKNKRELFSLPRKLNRLTKVDQYSEDLSLSIDSIEDSIQQECTCIKIEDPEELFIIDDYIVTHNTFCAAVYAALKGLLYPGTRTGIFAPAFRQSKLIFKEFTTLYEDSPILQECVDKAPVQLNDQCVCVFKSAARESQGSFIKAFPIGASGDKIRGQRISQVLMDEVPHIPESIFRSVVQPMMSTAKNPMQRVKQLEHLSRVYGGDIPEGMLSTDNGYIGITSGYYQFNYWWKTMQDFYKSIKTGSTKYNLRFVPYTELPPGFFEKDIVEDARMNAPTHMFLTEWMAEWIADSEGAFPMSLLESARDLNLEPKYARDPNKDKGREYVFGIDVARERDSTAISIVEIGYPSKLVCLFELENRAFPEQAKLILQLVEKFSPNLIYMDEFGGGQTLRDHLADPASVGWPATSKIISVDDSMGFSGKRILKLCNFNPAFIEDANNNTKTLLEQGMIKLPAANHPIEGYRKGNTRGANKEVDLVQELINQIASIVVTPTTTGRLHYDLPKTAANSLIPNIKKKDLYTSFILACKAIYDTQWKPKADRLIVQTGVVREIKAKDTNLLITGSDSVILDGRIIGGETNSTIYPQKTVIKGGGIIITRNGRKKR